MDTPDSLLIRADAGPEIGAGHVMRCLALAQQWQTEGGRAAFGCSEIPEALENRLHAEGCEVVIIGAAAGSPEDAVATLKLARDLDALVVADGYRFSIDYQEAVQAEAKGLLVLDDFGQIGSYCADMILDQNLGTTEEWYRDRPTGCGLLLGPEYIMLRREFLDTVRAEPRDVRPTVQNVLVTTGGSDVGGLAGRILGALDEISEPLSITVAAGRFGSGIRVLKARAQCSHHRICLIENAGNMRELMALADLAIGAAGSTVWELAYLGVPAVLGVVAENQRVGASALENIGAALVFDGRSPSVVEELRRLLGLVYCDQQRRSAMTDIAQRLVDGKGALRVASKIRATDMGRDQ